MQPAGMMHAVAAFCTMSTSVGPLTLGTPPCARRPARTELAEQPGWGAHATAVALRQHASDLRSRQTYTRRRRPVGLRPDVREIQAAEAMLSGFEVFEQFAAAAHPVTASVLGEVRPTPPSWRPQSALAA
jgi:hypothetical protein